MLHGDEVGADERNVINRPERLHNTGMVDTRNKDGEEISEEGRLFLEVEGEGFVVAKPKRREYRTKNGRRPNDIHLDIGNPDNDILELVVLPSIC